VWMGMGSLKFTFCRHSVLFLDPPTDRAASAVVDKMTTLGVDSSFAHIRRKADSAFGATGVADVSNRATGRLRTRRQHTAQHLDI